MTESDGTVMMIKLTIIIMIIANQSNNKVITTKPYCRMIYFLFFPLLPLLLPSLLPSLSH